MMNWRLLWPAGARCTLRVLSFLILIALLVSASLAPASLLANELDWEAEVLVEDNFITPPRRIIRLRNHFSGQQLTLDLDDETSGLQRERAEFLQTGDRVRLRFRRWPDRSRASFKLRGDLSRDNQATIESIVPAVPELNSAEALTAAAGGVDRRSLISFRIKYKGWGSAVSRTDVDNALFKRSDSASAVLKRTSYGAIDLYGDRDNNGSSDIYYFEVNKPSNLCDYTKVAREVDQMARDQNINITAWRHRAYFLPPEVSCGWAGVAYIGCSSSCQSFYDSGYIRSFWNDLIPHELGHNLGMRHSSADSNDDGNIDSGSTYTDHSCLMGNPSNVVELNLPHRYQLGLIDNQDLITSRSAASYNIAPTDISPSQTNLPLGMRLPIGSTSSKYYISYRRKRSGTFDNNLKSNYYNRLSIHRWSNSNTMLVGTLTVGQSRRLSTGDTIKLTSANANYAVVSVNGGGSPPTSPSPRPSASPSARPSSSPSPRPSASARPSSSPRPSATRRPKPSPSRRPSAKPSARPSASPRANTLSVVKTKLKAKSRKRAFYIKAYARVIDENKKGVKDAIVAFNWQIRSANGRVRMSGSETKLTRGSGRTKLSLRFRTRTSKYVPADTDRAIVSISNVQKSGYTSNQQEVEMLFADF